MVFGIVDKINNSDEAIKKLEKILEKNRKVKYYIINIEYTIN